MRSAILFPLAVSAVLGVRASAVDAHPDPDNGVSFSSAAVAGTTAVQRSAALPATFLLAIVLPLALGFMAIASGRRITRVQMGLLPISLAAAFLLSGAACGDGPKKGENPQLESDAAELAKLFAPFAKESVATRADADFLYVDSTAFPAHPMMVGIRAWQRQVPLPQPYGGKNAWRIPLRPKLADKPISAKTALFRGAIALAVNGVPIFNALNNRGEDAFLAGELDEYGGHCGRGDDYHYHTAPVHLEKAVGKGKPIGFALDGFPLYGYTDADGKEPTDLDEYNGRTEAGGYRYYSTRTFPYINGGLRGAVTVRGDQVEPQPKDAPVRPAGEPLRGAKITAFDRDDAQKTYTLRYDLRGQSLSWKYTIKGDGTYDFVYRDGDGRETAETYRRRERKDGPGPKKDGPPPKD